MEDSNDLTKTKAVAIRVIGRVQGVGFRAFTRRQARVCGVTGWVRNRPDGAVEAHLEGERHNVDETLKKLQIGPALARVDQLIVTPITEGKGYTTFEITF